MRFAAASALSVLIKRLRAAFALEAWRNFLRHKEIAIYGINIARSRHVHVVRLRIVQRPPAKDVDGLPVDRYELGRTYEVGNVLAEVMLAEGWAQPVADDSPAGLVSLPETEPLPTRAKAVSPEGASPSNLIREVSPPAFDHLGIEADRERRHQKRR